jgi:hypothetical protein
MMKHTLYRLYDHTDRNTLANAIPTVDQANSVLRLLQLEYPNNTIEIETYTRHD